MAALLAVAAVIVAVQYSRLGQGTPARLPPDAPPSGVPVFYAREPGNPHGLIAYDWSGTRRGRVTLPTWIEINRLRPAPDGSGFFINPATPGDYAAYFDRDGRTLFESNDPAFISQAWVDDSTHVCVLTDYGLSTRLPGHPDRTVPTPVASGYAVAGCSLRGDTALLASPTDLEVVRLSTGKTLRSLSTNGTVVASTDASFVAVSSGGAAPVTVYKTSDLSRPVAQLDGSLQPLAFSGDGSLLLTAQPGGVVTAVALRSAKVAWTYNTSPANVGFVLARPSGGDFVLYLPTAVVLVRGNGKTASFP